MKKKVAVLMSGGVDSSVAAYLLSRDFEVIGVTLKLLKCEMFKDTAKQLCCSPKDIYDAKSVASQLGIRHYVLNLTYEFKKLIIEKFCKDYMNGFTPNPCMWCNEMIKFGITFKRLKSELSIDYLSSGHYAKIIKERNKFYISKAKDDSKDQSYFLSRINPDVLPYLILPLGELTKLQVRQIAKDLGLKVYEKKESFDLCFIIDGDYRSFIKSNQQFSQKGKVIEYATKRFLGYHDGHFNYTIGQRKGLKLKNSNSKYYVVEIDPTNNILYVGTEDMLYKDNLIATNCIFYEEFDKLVKSKNLYAKIRYKSDLAECSVEKIDNDKVKIIFKNPQRAITKGQYVVVYDTKGKVLFSGEITDYSK
ncbi:MAG: tRNA 2-thiouridine(34) synthase MnmA [Endomicrobiia bacterium]